MHPARAPSIDRFSPLFYQNNWSTIKEEVSADILNFLNNGRMDPRMNNTMLILLPKVQEPKEVSEFRPISLVNASMRITSKILANRMKDFLPSIIEGTTECLCAK